MKINNKNLTKGITDNKPETPGKVKGKRSSGMDFKAHLSEINKKEIKERLDKLLKIVDREGEKLKKSLKKEDLLAYKKRVKDFLRLIQSEYAEAKQSYSWDGRGNVKTYTIIEKINRNITTLHDMFLKDQADVLEVVRKIDEIRGLLLDLYI